MYFEYKIGSYIHLYCLKLDVQYEYNNVLGSKYIRGFVIKEEMSSNYHNDKPYAFKIKDCIPITDPIIIKELDKLAVFK